MSTISKVRGVVKTDASNVSIEMPVLISDGGEFSLLVNYFVVKVTAGLSLSWMNKCATAVQKFLQYAQANPAERGSYKLFQNFALHLQKGTFGTDGDIDPTWLCWERASLESAASTVHLVQGFLAHLAPISPMAAAYVPQMPKSGHELVLAELAAEHRRNHSLLGHLWNEDSVVQEGTITKTRRTPRSRPSNPPAFPEDRFGDLVSKGFQTRNGEDIRGKLITILLNQGGVRCSEPFHMFMTDVVEDPSNPRSALVYLHHPSLGAPPGDWLATKGGRKAWNRADYLREKFGLLPRDEIQGKRHAGWKGGFHKRQDGYFFKQVEWFPPRAGEVFMDLWRRYILQVANLGARRAHPYAWINFSGEVGSPYKLDAFIKAHDAAVLRIGLKARKEFGTTPHGHRHAYGRRNKAGELPEKIIQTNMHHASIESQKTYTQPTQDEIKQILERGNEVLEKKAQRKGPRP